MSYESQNNFKQIGKTTFVLRFYRIFANTTRCLVKMTTLNSPIQQKNHVRFVKSTVKFSKSLVNFWKIQVKITTWNRICQKSCKKWKNHGKFYYALRISIYCKIYGWFSKFYYIFVVNITRFTIKIVGIMWVILPKFF